MSERHERDERDERDDTAEQHIAQMIVRMRHLDELDEQHGLTRGRERQARALAWALNELRELYPTASTRAVGIANRICRMIRENRKQREHEGEQA